MGLNLAAVQNNSRIQDNFSTKQLQLLYAKYQEPGFNFKSDLTKLKINRQNRPQSENRFQLT